MGNSRGDLVPFVYVVYLRSRGIPVIHSCHQPYSIIDVLVCDVYKYHIVWISASVLNWLSM